MFTTFLECPQMSLGVRMFYHSFSNSLIIHEEKTKEITTVKEVWICDPNYHKIRRSFALIFSKNYQCFEKLWLRLLHLLYDKKVIRQKKTISHAISVLYSDKTWVFDPNRSARMVQSILK